MNGFIGNNDILGSVSAPMNDECEKALETIVGSIKEYFSEIDVSSLSEENKYLVITSDMITGLNIIDPQNEIDASIIEFLENEGIKDEFFSLGYYGLAKESLAESYASVLIPRIAQSYSDKSETELSMVPLY